MKLLQKWKRFTHRTVCLNCGFLSINGHEADADARLTIAAKGKAGWFVKEAQIDCHKGLWYWDGDSASVVIYEANQPRLCCVGFHRHVPGRSPEEHLKLEDEGREFSRQRKLALIPFIAALLGALIGAGLMQRLLHK
jgi:hypothetical protein